MGSPLLDAALGYAARGWHVFPVEVGGKRPLGALAPQGKDNATTDPATIRAWWQAAPQANVGIALAPSRLLVLDVDTAGDKQGAASLREIVGDLGPLTLAQRTGRGGRHLVYRAPDGVEPTNRLGFKPGLDLIGVGYIVAAPSVLHEGGAYAWHNDAPIAPCPPILAKTATERPARKQVDGPSGAKVIEGGRNNALFRLGASLRDSGLALQAIQLALLATNEGQCVPPLPDDEVLRIAESAFNSVKPSRDVLLGESFAQADWPGGPLGQQGTQPPAPVQAALGASPSHPAPGATVAGGGAPLLSEIALRERPPLRTYPTAFKRLDELIGGGWITRTLTTLLGPPGAGKTAYVVGAAMHAAREHGLPILHACTELESEEITYRYAAPTLGCAWTELERGGAMIDGEVIGGVRTRRRVEGGDLRAAVHGAVDGHRIHVFGSESLRSAEQAIEQVARETQRLTGLYGVPPIVVVDYLQDLARGAADEKAVRAKVGELATHLRALSQAFDCVVLMVSSVSRGWYGPAKAETMRKSDDAGVYLTAAKESGDVDYASATVTFLDVAPDDGGATRPARLIVAKARRGRTGFAGARFEGASGRWTDDPGALAEMSPEAMKAARQDKQSSELLDRVHGYMLTAGVQLSKRDVEREVTGNNEQIREAVDALVLQGRVVQVGKSYMAVEPRPPGTAKPPGT